MDRRSFFRSALDKGSKTIGKAVVKAADAKVKQQALRWIRPPFAINELEFLLSCTRCTDCIDACPHDVIFALSAKTGARSVATPALDLLNKGCHLCEDWPCVSACEAQSLKLPDDEQANQTSSDDDSDDNNAKPQLESSTTNKVHAKLARVSINETHCLPFSGPECGACISSCPVDGALTLDMVKPVIDALLCSGCGLCRQACITEPKAIDIASL